MPTKKPVIKMPERTGEASKTLMGNQDTRRKGDSTGKDKVLVTFWVSPEKRDELKAYAAEHDMTQSRVIIEGINWRIKQD